MEELDLNKFALDRKAFAEACSYMVSPSFTTEQLKTLLEKDATLASSVGKHGSAAYYAADRDGDEEFVSYNASQSCQWEKLTLATLPHLDKYIVGVWTCSGRSY